MSEKDKLEPDLEHKVAQLHELCSNLCDSLGHLIAHVGELTDRVEELEGKPSIPHQTH